MKPADEIPSSDEEAAESLAIDAGREDEVAAEQGAPEQNEIAMDVAFGGTALAPTDDDRVAEQFEAGGPR